MSDLFGNHIVGFPTRRLICNKLEIRLSATELLQLLSYQHCKSIYIVDVCMYLSFTCVSNLLLLEILSFTLRCSLYLLL